MTDTRHAATASLDADVCLPDDGLPFLVLSLDIAKQLLPQYGRFFPELHLNKTLMEDAIAGVLLHPDIMTFQVRHFFCLYISASISALVNPGAAIGVDLATGFVDRVAGDGGLALGVMLVHVRDMRMSKDNDVCV